MNDETIDKAKKRMQEAFEQTKPQIEDAANQLTSLFKKGAAKAKEAAEAAQRAVRDDINKRP